MVAKREKGRPSRYNEKTPELAKAYARDGLTMEQIAHNLGISRPTLYEWQKKHPELREALQEGREVVDIQVENALLKRALGYEYEEIETIVKKDDRGTTPARVKKVKKHMAPEMAAMIFWLKNRVPQKWRDKPDAGKGDKARAAVTELVDRLKEEEQGDANS